MRVLFVYPNDYLSNGIPTGIAVLSAVLKQKHHIVDIFDFTFIKTKKQMSDDIEFLQNFYEIVDSGLMEKDNPIDTYEGYVKNNGCYDEDFSPTVGCVPINEMIYDKYNGLKVRVIVEVLE